MKTFGEKIQDAIWKGIANSPAPIKESPKPCPVCKSEEHFEIDLSVGCGGYQTLVVCKNCRIVRMDQLNSWELAALRGKGE